MVASLISLGADVMAPDNGGHTALSVALMSLPNPPSAKSPEEKTAIIAAGFDANANRLQKINAIALLLLDATAAVDNTEARKGTYIYT